jgi:hypothetical protein
MIRFLHISDWRLGMTRYFISEGGAGFGIHFSGQPRPAKRGVRAQCKHLHRLQSCASADH